MTQKTTYCGIKTGGNMRGHEHTQNTCDNGMRWLKEKITQKDKS